MPKEIGRGMSVKKENVWKVVYKKEDSMKLKWFQKNQEKLVADCEKKTLRKGLSPEIIEEVEKMRIERYRTMERKGRHKGEKMHFPEIDPHCIKNVMKSVDPEMKKLLYSTLGKDGRKNYLKERYTKCLPEQRYFFAECSSFVYGWLMFDNMRVPKDDARYGRQQVIKRSFYRRNGALRHDTEFHRLPQVLSPMVCGQI